MMSIFLRRWTFLGPALALVAVLAAAPARAATLLDEVGQVRSYVRLHPSRALEKLEKLADAARASEPAARGEYMLQLGTAELRSGQPARAGETAERLLRLATAAGDTSLRVKGLLLKGNILASQNQHKEAHQVVWEAQQLAAQSHDVVLRLDADISAGQAYTEAGQYQEALALLLPTVDTARQQGVTELTIAALQKLGDLYDTMGDPARGLVAVEEALDLARRNGNDGQVATLRITEYGLASSLGDHPRAIDALRSALLWAHAHDVDEVAAIASSNLAQTYLDVHKPEMAYRYAGDALRIASLINDDRVANAARMIRGHAALLLGRVDEGKRYIDRSVEYVKRGGDVPQLLSDLDQYSTALELAGDADGALRVARRVRRISDELNSAQRSRAVAEVQGKYEDGKRQQKLDELERENKARRIEMTDQRRRLAIFVVLATAAGVLACLLALLLARLRRAHHQLGELSVRDPLTTLYNRRHFQHLMADRVAIEKRARRRGPGDVSLLLVLDVDHFKQVNDTHGHAAGDAVLQSVAACLRRTLRETDMIVRWGGEEFLAYIDAVPLGEVDDVARRILAGVAGSTAQYQDTAIAVTVSVGFAQLPLAGADGLSLERAIALADQALYMAKHDGRNRAYGLRRFCPEGRPSIDHIERHFAEAARCGLIDLIAITA